MEEMLVDEMNANPDMYPRFTSIDQNKMFSIQDQSSHLYKKGQIQFGFKNADHANTKSSVGMKPWMMKLNGEQLTKFPQPMSTWEQSLSNPNTVCLPPFINIIVTYIIDWDKPIPDNPPIRISYKNI